ncbi:MAG: hypothetical protein ABJG15_17740 [Hyphomonadaceae bacterium]
MFEVNSAISTIRRNWFVAAFLATVFSCYMVASTDTWASPKISELGLLFDLTVFAPFLYWLCYRKQQTRRKTVLRMIVVASVGVFVAKQLVPGPEQFVLAILGWLKSSWVVVLLFIEVFAGVALLKLLFSSTDDISTKQELVEKYEVPEWLASFMVWEANFWRRVLKWMTGKK